MSFGSTARGLTLMTRRSLRQHAVSTAITVFSVALSSGLLMAVFSINAQAHRAFTGGPVGFDAVLGARGSQLQLVLNTVFHLETSPGNIPWKLYQQMRRDFRVALAIPYAVGDNYRGYRVVGTVEELFTAFEYRQGRKFQILPDGRVFDPSKREAVIGAAVADQTGLTAGSIFSPQHGILAESDERHKEEFTVSGVMEWTHSPSDRVIWIPIEHVFRMSGHVLRGDGEIFHPRPDEPIGDEHKEVSAVMIKFRNPQAGFMLDQAINRGGKEATLAWPIGRVMAELFDKMGWVHRVLAAVAYLIAVVAAASILASIYNTIQERRREFAILRALGARRRTIFSAVVMESSAISVMGTAAGYVFYAGVLAAVSAVVRAQTGVALEIFYFHPALVLTPIGMTLMGAVAGVIPAAKAYATDVAGNLNPVS